MRLRRVGTRPIAAALVIGCAFGCEALVTGQIGVVHCEAEGRIGPPACPSASICSQGLCVPTKLGSACTSNVDCTAPEFCLDPSLAGLPGEKRCARTCCTSTDCNPNLGDVCVIGPDGTAGFCAAAALVGRGEPGHRQAWAACARDADCRSGACVAGRCADTCCKDTNCTLPGGACRYSAAPPIPLAHPGFYCDAYAPSNAPYTACTADADCASGLCVPFPAHPVAALAGPVPMRCTVHCCSSTDCNSLGETATAPVICMDVERDGGAVRGCVPGMASRGTADVGVSCVADTDCRSGRCVTMGSVSRCTDTCCEDVNCGDPSFVCRPAMCGLECTIN